MADFRGVSEQTVKLALAVNPVDARTGEPLRDAAAVSVEGVRERPRLNPAGYWLFLDPPVELPDDVVVTVDAPPRYVDRTVTDPSRPGVRVDVYPSRAYTLPPGTTQILGTVVDDSGVPVSGAQVRLQETDLETRTDAAGEFILAVEGIVTTESARLGDVLRVDPGSDNPERVRVYPLEDPPDAPPRHGPRESPTLAVSRPHDGSDDETTTTVQITEGERIELGDVDAPA